MPSTTAHPTLTVTDMLHLVTTITGQRDRDQLARSLLGIIVELTHSSHVTLYRIVGDEAILVAHTSLEAADLSASTELSIVIAERPDFTSVLNLGVEHIQSIDEHHARAIFPIHGKQEIVALVELSSAVHGDKERKLVSAFLKVYSNYLTLLDESETDTLTGLLNRRTFDNNLEKLLTECTTVVDDDPALNPHSRLKANPELPHWLAVMDIDHFKRINDEFGHLYGDEVLLLLSRCMRRNFRQSDKLFRFGGEEFVVVLDRTCQSNAIKILERFRTAIENYNFPQVGKVTISIGLVCLNGIDDPSSLVGRADQALYYAKEHGRNQVCFYEALLAEGNLAPDRFTDDVMMF